MPKMSLNRNAFEIVKEMMDKADEIHAKIVELKNGATIISADGFKAGMQISKCRYGGLVNMHIGWNEVEDLRLPSLNIWTDHPALAILGSQVGSRPEQWDLTDDFKGLLGKGYPIVAGPARALAVDRPEVYKMLGYEDDSDIAVMTVQLDKTPLEKFPSEKLVDTVARKCGVNPENIYILLSMNQTLAGIIQIASCTLEPALLSAWHLYHYNVTKFKHACGIVPIVPVTPDAFKAMTMANDSEHYCPRNIYYLETDEGEDVAEVAKKLILRTTCKAYGMLYEEAWAKPEIGNDFFKGSYFQGWMMALASITINDLRTGKVCTAGEARFDLLKKALASLQC